jgi:hypothetical protein
LKKLRHYYLKGCGIDYVVGGKVYLTGVSISPKGKPSKAVRDIRTVERQFTRLDFLASFLPEMNQWKNDGGIWFHIPGVIHRALIINYHSLGSWHAWLLCTHVFTLHETSFHLCQA